MSPSRGSFARGPARTPAMAVLAALAIACIGIVHLIAAAAGVRR